MRSPRFFDRPRVTCERCRREVRRYVTVSLYDKGQLPASRVIPRATRTWCRDCADECPPDDVTRETYRPGSLHIL